MTIPLDEVFRMYYNQRMNKTMCSFRLDQQAVEDLDFCVKAAKLRMEHYGYLGPSQGEIVGQALGRLARYYRTLETSRPILPKNEIH